MPFNIMGIIQKFLQGRRQKRSEHQFAKLAQRDQERQTDGLLRIAMKRHNSINSFTAADPSVHYRRREDHEKFVQHEAGGHKVNHRYAQSEVAL